MSKGYAIITGAARGLGRAMFLQLASDGYDLIGVYATEKSAPKMQALIDQVEKENGVRAAGVRSNVGTVEGCRAVVDFAVKTFGTDLAVLINNAGVQEGKFFKDETSEEIAHVINVDLLGGLNMINLVLPYMVERKGGDIISMSSVCALEGVATQCVYSAAKNGLIGFSKSLAKEVAQYNIKVNCIAPGMMNTDMMAESDPQQRAALEATIPMGRLGDPQEIALCASYILKSNYLTGQTISPNGGFVSIP